MSGCPASKAAYASRIAALLLMVCLSPVAAASDRLAGIAELIRAEKGALARERLLAAQSAYQAEKNTRGETRALILLGFANMSLGDDALARTNIEQAATMLAAEGEPFGAAMALLFLAGAESQREQWDAAVKHHEAALQMLRSAAGRRPSFDLLADLAPLFGYPTEVFEMLLALMPHGSSNIVLQLFEAMNRDALGGALVELGELDRAEAELNRAAEISSSFFGMLDASIAEHRGDLARRRWNFDEARRQYEKALANTSTLPLNRTWNEWTELKIMRKLEDVELLSGRLEAALAWNDKALQFVRQRKQRTREASILQNRGTLLMQVGRMAEARSILERAESLAEDVWDVELQASILTDIGSLHMFEGNYGHAAATLEKALAIYPLTNDLRGESHAWMMLTEVYLSLAAYEDADVLMQKACALATRSDYRPALALVDKVAAIRATMNGPAENSDAWKELESVFTLPDIVGAPLAAMLIFQEMKVLLEAGTRSLRDDVAGARQAFRKLLDTSFNRDIRAGALAGLGTTYLKEGKNAEAIGWFRQAADTVEETLPSIQDDMLLARYLGAERHRYFDIAIELMLREGLVEDAFDYTERARARAFLRTIGNHRVASHARADAELVREAETLRTRIVDWERNGAPLRTDLDHARKHYATLITRLKTTNPEYASFTRVEPLRLAAIRAEVPADSTLVSYFMTARGAHAFVVDRQSAHHIALPLDAAALRRAVCWAETFQTRRMRGAKPRSAQCAQRATAAEVYERLIAPLRPKIRNARVIIVPHGVLHYIPFAALYDAKREQYLIETHTLTFAPSASALRFLREKESPVAGRSIVLGDPVNRSSGLPGAKNEAIAAARDLGTTPLLGRDAKESALFALAGSADLVHIGAHAEFDALNPLFSRIELAEGDGRDGFLEVHEILGELDLTGVNLVVLSACETAIGERSGGDDVVGLTRAILYAGSPAVISTLWKIGDDAADALMQEFYRRFTRGESAADALREAQLSLLRSGRFADPRHWAAFTLTGYPRVHWSHEHKSRGGVSSEDDAKDSTLLRSRAAGVLVHRAGSAPAEHTAAAPEHRVRHR